MASDVIHIQTELDNRVAETCRNEAVAVKPNARCESCEKKHFAEIESLQNELQLKEAKISELTSHIHKLETDSPTKNKKRRLGDLGKDDMHEATMKASATLSKTLLSIT